MEMADKSVKKPGFFARVKNTFTRIGKYFRDTRGELKKVVWPTKKQALNSTGVVIVVVIVAALVMILLDAVFGGIVRLMIGV